MRKRDLRLDKYGISKQRYNELVAFVKQYPEWKEELLNMQDSVGGITIDGMPKGSFTGDSTGRLAIRRAILSQKVTLVDEALEEAGGDLKQYLYIGVCEGKSFDELKLRHEIPCERDTYYDIRRFFFFVLNKKRESLAFYL